MLRPVVYRIEVTTISSNHDARAHRLMHDIEALGIARVSAAKVASLYFIESDMPQGDIQRLCDSLLVDSNFETARIGSATVAAPLSAPPAAQTIEWSFLPGVTDSAAESLRQGAQTIGFSQLGQISVGQQITLTGNLSSADAITIAERLVINPVIQTFAVGTPIAPPFGGQLPADVASAASILFGDASDAALLELSRVRRLALDLPEVRAIEQYFRQQKRDPTDVELEMLAQTWSEHCVHKTFKARIIYTAEGAAPCLIDGLLNTYIRAATEAIAKPWVVSAFVDNAGIVSFNDAYDIAFKVETHNHPSALEPFGGANTGVGGVVRDVIGVSARPIANTDVLCFGPADLPLTQLPIGVIHPRRIADGVTRGIEDYGNKMGIPTVNGAFCFDDGYIANPLVFCGCVGLLPKGSHPRNQQPGDLIVVIGGSTGRDGIGGATFSSMQMGVETAQIADSSVQIGHPIHEKQTLEAILMARAEKLYSAITDCGAGGLSSAIGEMGAELGAEVHLDRLPLKYAGLRPWEIWLSEAQERMVLAVPPPNWPRVQAICQGLDIDATVLGSFTGDRRIRLTWHGSVVGDLSTEFLNDGIPRQELTALWAPSEAVSAARPTGAGADVKLATDLLALLARPGTRSSEHIVRHFDHEVQGGTVVKPFVGIVQQGPSDAAVICPQDVWRSGPDSGMPIPGIALSVGINPALGKIDPYAMAWSAIDEAIRNCVAVGADPDHIAILDNFCWGNPRLPDRLGSLVRCCQGCYDAAIDYGTPFVSGKDSLNNEFLGADGKKHAIPGTLLISAMGIVPDIARTMTSDLKGTANQLWMVGVTRNETAASAYDQMVGLTGGRVPVAPANALAAYRALHQAIRAGLVVSCHDCSEGGLAVAVAEMVLGGGIGAEIMLDWVPKDDTSLPPTVIAFSESLGRLVVEVPVARASDFRRIMADHPAAQIGRTTEIGKLAFCVQDAGEVRVLSTATLSDIEHAFCGHLLEAA